MSEEETYLEEVLKQVRAVPEDQWRAACAQAGLGPRISWWRHPIEAVRKAWRLRHLVNEVADNLDNGSQADHDYTMPHHWADLEGHEHSPEHCCPPNCPARNNGSSVDKS